MDMIQVSGLQKSFGELKVLQGIDQVVQKGEKLVIIGPSGSGLSLIHIYPSRTPFPIYI